MCSRQTGEGDGGEGKGGVRKKEVGLTQIKSEVAWELKLKAAMKIHLKMSQKRSSNDKLFNSYSDGKFCQNFILIFECFGGRF